MVEALNSSNHSATKSIAATSVLAGILNASIQTACEAINANNSKKLFRQAADEYVRKAIEMEKAGNTEASKFFAQIAQEATNSLKNCKISWKNVGYGALIGATATAVICTTLHAISSLFNKNKKH